MATERPLAFALRVYGQPAPQGSKRHVGGGRMVESSAAVEPWREAVKSAARKVIDGAVDEFFRAFDCPLSVEMVFTLRKPASAPKRRRTWPDRRPDIDKLTRSSLDALVDAGVLVDDARIVDLRVRKVFAGEDPHSLSSPGCIVRIWRVTEEVT